MKKSFLLSMSESLLVESGSGSYYDKIMDINYSCENNIYIPAVTLGGSLITQSKTLAAPGDDDPDSEAEGCY